MGQFTGFVCEWPGRPCAASTVALVSHDDEQPLPIFVCYHHLLHARGRGWTEARED